VSTSDPTGTDWTDQEVDLIVADYFDMLQLDLAGTHYVKSHRNAELQRLTGRSRGSIEFKHQNISAVLLRLGLPWIAGYKPMANFQNALIDGIGRYLAEAGAQFDFLQPPKPHPMSVHRTRILPSRPACEGSFAITTLRNGTRAIAHSANAAKSSSFAAKK
jgi:hypothetical protein